MAAKVTFDHTTKRIRPVGPPVNGVIVLDVQVDLYSDAKEDWLADTTLQKFRFPVEPIGGQTVSAGQLGATYLLVNGWRLDPNLSANYSAGVTQTSQEPVYGSGGTNEAVHQEITLTQPAFIHHEWVTVRRVGNPTDSLRCRVHDATFTNLSTVDIDGEIIPSSFTEIFIAYEDPVAGAAGQQVHVHFERTGARDLVNYYEIAIDENEPYAPGQMEIRDNGTFAPRTPPADLLIRWDESVPYQLQINGNIFTDSGLPVSLSTSNVNVQQTVSTLVEVRTDATAAADLELIRKILDNGLRTDPATGKLTLYDDDGTTPIRQWDIYEDVAGTQPYRGQGTERRDAPVQI